MKIICIGRNYTEHIEELANERPKDPVVFMKPDTAILLKKQPFFIPDFSDNDYIRVLSHDVSQGFIISEVDFWINRTLRYAINDVFNWIFGGNDACVRVIDL